MSAVGAVYEKLVKFLEASGAIKSATTEASADESAQ
jgi:hypothetical protein